MKRYSTVFPSVLRRCRSHLLGTVEFVCLSILIKCLLYFTLISLHSHGFVAAAETKDSTDGEMCCNYVITVLLVLIIQSYAAYDRGKCEACMWLHAKLREDHEKLNPKVRKLGGFKKFSRAEIAAKAVDGWCDGIKEVIYSNTNLPGTEELRQFTFSDLSTLLAVCKDLQVRYRLNAVSLLSAATTQKNLPLSILCLDDCKKGGRKKFEKPPKGDTPIREFIIPDDNELQTMKVCTISYL